VRSENVPCDSRSLAWPVQIFAYTSVAAASTLIALRV